MSEKSSPQVGVESLEKHRALVAGATGYTGLAVVDSLCRQGIETWAHVRPDSPKLAYWREYFEERGARVSNVAWTESEFVGAMKEIEPSLVFALVGTTRARARALAKEGGDAESETYDRIDYGLSSLLIRSAATCERLFRFVYLSAAGTRAGSSNRYMRARWNVEEELRASGLPHTIIRPALITGPDRLESRPLETLGAGIVGASLAVLGSMGFSRAVRDYASIGGRELGQALVRLALDREWENKVAFRRDLSES